MNGLTWLYLTFTLIKSAPLNLVRGKNNSFQFVKIFTKMKVEMFAHVTLLQEFPGLVFKFLSTFLHNMES